MAQNEDLDYNISDVAIPDPEDKTQDPDKPNKSVLKEVQKYLGEQIIRHNTFDVITPEAENIMTTQQQVEMHKQIVSHLRTVKEIIDNKIKELKNNA